MAFEDEIAKLGGTVIKPPTEEATPESIMRLGGTVTKPGQYFPPQTVDQFESGQNPLVANELARGVARGTAQGAASAMDFMRVFHDSPKLKAIADSLNSTAEQLPTKVGSVSDVLSDPSLAPAYVARVVGELAPQAVAAYLSGGAGAAGARLAGMGAAGTRLAVGAGAAATSIPQEVGSMFRETEDLTGKGNAAAALGFGIPSGMLDAISAERIIGQIFRIPDAEGKRMAWRQIVREAVKEVPKAAGVEATTETMQEGLALLADKSADHTFQLLTPENGSRLLESAVAGAIGGGLLGGGSNLASLPAQAAARGEEATRLRTLRGMRDTMRSRYDRGASPEVATVPNQQLETPIVAQPKASTLPEGAIQFESPDAQVGQEFEQDGKRYRINGTTEVTRNGKTRRSATAILIDAQPTSVVGQVTVAPKVEPAIDVQTVPLSEKGSSISDNNRAQLLSDIQRGAHTRDMNDAMRELGGVGTSLSGDFPNVQAHGTTTLSGLVKILDSFDPNQTFYTGALERNPAIRTGAETRLNSPFVVVGKPDTLIKSRDDIAGVLVDDLHAPEIDKLRQAFPGVRFESAREVNKLLGTHQEPIKSTPQVNTQPASEVSAPVENAQGSEKVKLEGAVRTSIDEDWDKMSKDGASLVRQWVNSGILRGHEVKRGSSKLMITKPAPGDAPGTLFRITTISSDGSPFGHMEVSREQWDAFSKDPNKLRMTELGELYDSAQEAVRPDIWQGSPGITLGEPTEFHYRLRNRDVGVGTTPKGFVRASGRDVTYNRPLTSKEIYDFEITPIGANPTSKNEISKSSVAGGVDNSGVPNSSSKTDLGSSSVRTDAVAKPISEQGAPTVKEVINDGQRQEKGQQENVLTAQSDKGATASAVAPSGAVDEGYKKRKAEHEEKMLAYEEERKGKILKIKEEMASGKIDKVLGDKLLAIWEIKQPSKTPTPSPSTPKSDVSAKTSDDNRTNAPKFKMTFQQFFDAPREGELLDELRKLPKSEPSANEVAAKARYAAAAEAVEKKGLSWIYDRGTPSKQRMVEASIRKLKGENKKIVDEYNSASNASTQEGIGGREARQRVLYDKAVAAGIIENPESKPDQSREALTAESAKYGTPEYAKQQLDFWKAQLTQTEQLGGNTSEPSMRVKEWQRVVDQSGRESVSEASTTLGEPEAKTVVERWQKDNPNAPQVEVVNDPAMMRTGADGVERGVKGLWRDGKLIVNTAFIADEAELIRTLNHERAHSILSTVEGQKQLREIVLHEAQTEIDVLRSKYAQRDGESDADYEARLVEEYVARSNEGDQTVWQRIIAAVRRFLAKAGLVKLSDEEVARAIVQSADGSAQVEVGERESIANDVTNRDRDELPKPDPATVTEWFRNPVKILGKTQYDEAAQAKSRALAKEVYDKAGVKVVDQSMSEGTVYWKIDEEGLTRADGVNFLKAAKEIFDKYPPGSLELTEIARSLGMNALEGRFEKFGVKTRNELANLALSETSFRGVSLAATRGAPEDLMYLMQNLDISLNRMWHGDYGGKEIDAVIEKFRKQMLAFFSPEVLNEIVKANPDLAKVQDAASIIRNGLESNFQSLPELKDVLSDLLQAAGIEPKRANKLATEIIVALKPRIRVAAGDARRNIEEALTPDEKAAVKGSKKPIWIKLIEAVARGEFDNGPLLRDKAKANGWSPPTDEEIARIKALVKRVQGMLELTKKERDEAGGDAKKAALLKIAREQTVLGDKAKEIRKLEAAWANITKPVNLWPWRFLGNHRANNAAFMNELASANLLWRTSFPTKQAISVVAQFMTHVPTRAVAMALERHAQAKELGQPTDLMHDLYDSMKGSLKAVITGYKDGVAQFVAALRGRGEVRNIDRLMSGIAALERIDAQMIYYAEQKQWGKALMMWMAGALRLGYRVAQAFDNLHGVPSEYVEMRHQVVKELMRNGKGATEAESQADNVLTNIKARYMSALAEAKHISEEDGKQRSSEELREIAHRIARNWAYEDMRNIGLPADEFKQANQNVREVFGWNEQEIGKGIGGAVGYGVKRIGQAGESVGIPLALGRFANAISIGINRALHFTPLGFFPKAFSEDNAWYRTELDRNQRKVEAALGTALGGIAIAMALSGAFVVRLRWPKDPEERDLMEARGEKPGTIMIPLGNGKFIVLSMNTGFLTPLAPYLAAGGALNEVLDTREKAQAKLNAEAAKKGLQPSKIRPLSMGDMAGVAAMAAYQTALGGRTSGGAVASLTDYGTFNFEKAVASQVTAIVPGLPALQEISRMSGVVLDSKLATFGDFLLPLPTSQARRVNFLGDPAGTPDDLQRIVQTLSGGNYPVIDTENAKAKAAYEVMFASDVKPPSINPNKGYSIGGAFRPFNDSELERYSVERGRAYKEALSALPADADAKTVRAALTDANNRALATMGVASAGRVVRSVARGSARPKFGRGLRSRGLRSLRNKRTRLRSRLQRF